LGGGSGKKEPTPKRKDRFKVAECEGKDESFRRLEELSPQSSATLVISKAIDSPDNNKQASK
jgi:hypothetical protein